MNYPRPAPVAASAGNRVRIVKAAGNSARKTTDFGDYDSRARPIAPPHQKFRFRRPASRSPLASAVARLSAVALALLGLAVPACDRPSPTPKNSQSRQQEVVPAPPTPPQYTFAANVREQNPEVAAFVRQFMETCLAGDYTGYRKLVSRAREPESKDRFQAVYYAIRAVTVESIEPVELREIPQPAYLVISAIDFLPERSVALRGGNRRIAIIVFREEGEWRMVPAPSDLQPHDDPATATASAPSESLPAADYPWDQDGDY